MRSKQKKTAAWEALIICRQLYPWKVFDPRAALTAWEERDTKAALDFAAREGWVSAG